MLGEVRFDGGKLFAPYLRYQGAGGDLGGLMGPTGSGKSASMSMDDVMKFMQTPQHLYFVFPAANPNGKDHLRILSDTTFGFEDLPDSASSDESFDDFIFQIIAGQ